jgi:ribosomal 30S subunit maturation factor RimM
VLNRKDEKIGKVERVFHTKANDIIVVMGKKEIFIPMVEGYIARIDLKGSFIKIDEEALLV